MADGPDTRPSLLIRLKNARDERAWGDFVNLYSPLVYGFARKQGLQDADAADLTQDAFRAVAGGIGRFNYDPRLGTFRGWLFTIVRHQLCDFRERLSKEVSTPDDSNWQTQLDLRATTNQDLEAEWDREYERHLFAAAAERIKNDFQSTTWSAFWSTAVDGEVPADVASRLGMSVAAVYLARSRIMARLRDQVREWSEE